MDGIVTTPGRAGQCLLEAHFPHIVHDALTIEPAEPFGSVRFTSFDVVFLDAAGTAGGADFDADGQIDLVNFSAPMNAVVPIGQTATAGIQIVSFENKATPPVACLGPLEFLDYGECTGVNAVEFAVSARITFHGVEETSGDKITLTRGLYVTIADLYSK